MIFILVNSSVPYLPLTFHFRSIGLIGFCTLQYSHNYYDFWCCVHSCLNFQRGNMMFWSLSHLRWTAFCCKLLYSFCNHSSNWWGWNFYRPCWKLNEQQINEFLKFITGLVFSTHALPTSWTHTLGGQADIHIYIDLQIAFKHTPLHTQPCTYLRTSHDALCSLALESSVNGTRVAGRRSQSGNAANTVQTK